MNKTENRAFTVIGLLLAAIGMTGCGGSKLLKAPLDVEETGPLASASDGRLTATLERVTVRNGPGSWAEDADWDQYQLALVNHAGDPIRINEIAVIDSRGHAQTGSGNRKKLVDGSREVARRYRDEDIELKAGIGGSTLMAAGTASYVVGLATGIAALTSFSDTAANAALAAIAIAPALAVGGAVKSMNEDEVARGIAERRTPMPVILEPELPTSVTAFYPLAPSPLRVEVRYEINGEICVLSIDTAAALDGLHLEPADGQPEPGGSS